MYEGYQSGVLGWEKPEETEETRFREEKIEYFVGMVNHWAALNKRIVFTSNLGSAIELSANTRHVYVQVSDILNDKADPRTLVLEVIGRVT